MSRLQTVRCHRVGIPLHTPFVTALRRATTVESLLVETVNDLDAAWWLERPPGPGGLTYEGASIVLPDAPGLGIEEVARP